MSTEAENVQLAEETPVVEVPEESAEESRDSVVSGEVEDKSVSGSEDKSAESEGVEDEDGAENDEDDETPENPESVENIKASLNAEVEVEENGNEIKDSNGNDRKRVSDAHEAAEGDEEAPVCKKKKTDDDEVETVDQAEAVISAE